MTDSLNKHPRNFFAEWTNRQNAEAKEALSIAQSLRDASRIVFTKRSESGLGSRSRSHW